MAILKSHREHLEKAGFEIISVEEKTVPAWFKMKYLLKYGKRKFKVLVEHEGSGLDFNLEGSEGGYLSLTISGW